MNAICVIPARGGSVRLPRKNIRMFHGKPIIAYSIEAAKASGLFDRIIVSTDDADIAFVADSLGAETCWRDPDDGTKGTQEVTADVLRTLNIGHGHACCLYATAPMVSIAALKYAQMLLKDSNYAFAVSVDPLADAGQFYFGYARAFVTGLPLISSGTRLVTIERERVCDINTMEDFERAERMYAELVSKGAL